MFSHNTSSIAASGSAASRTQATLWRLGLLLVLGLALLLRLLWIDADAATTLTWSGAPFTDEGLYSHAARNRVLFGIARTNEWDNRLVSPLFDGLAFVVFSLFGVGFVQVRLISIVFATVALLLFWSLLRSDWGPRWALLGASLWGLDYFWLQYSRLGLLEPSMVAWLVAAAWCWRRALGGSAWWSIGCGACAALACVWKSLALIWLPVPLLALLLLNRRWTRWPIAVGYLLGLALALGLYGLIWYLPHRGELTAYNQFYAADRVPQTLQEALQVFGRNIRSTYIWGQTPVLLGVALAGTFKALLAWRDRSLAPSVALALAWALCGAGLLLMPYSPPRYYTLVLPALVVLAVFAVAHADNQYFQYFQSLMRYGPALLLTACLLWNGWWYLRWAAARRTTLPDSARAVERLVPRGELVLGVAACGLSPGNTLPCAPPFVGLANDRLPVETLGARYALVEEGNRDDYLRRFYGPLLARSIRLGQLPLGSRRLTLYRLDEPAAGDR
ncbi:MAG TPA: glycosyltransferase family 39 protein [Herpetosiphonaceae bacterium]